MTIPVDERVEFTSLSDVLTSSLQQILLAISDASNAPVRTREQARRMLRTLGLSASAMAGPASRMPLDQ